MKNFLLIILTVFMMVGCVPEALMRTWSSNEEYDRKFKNLMVMGLVNNVNLRNDVENQVVAAAIKTDLLATNGMSMFPPELGKPFDDTERVKERLREKGFDGILTVALIDVRAERYVPPDASYEPLVYYDRFRNYYFRTYELVYRPGYFAQATRFFIETNFYELQGGKLVWSGRSGAFDPSQLQDYLPNYARGLFKELSMEGIITK